MTENEAIKYIEQHGYIADEIKDLCIGGTDAEREQGRLCGKKSGLADGERCHTAACRICTQYGILKT